jgi:predicted ATP-binding protein involved in virulence
LSSGENALLNLFSRIYTFIEDNLSEKTQSLPVKKHYIILLDEADLAFHPTWKKKFIKSIVSSIPYFFENIIEPPSIQIIFTSHDPLTLSDIPKENIVYLNKDENYKMIIVDSAIKKSFGANITDLLADSFFVEDGLIGEFAKMKIENTIQWLNENKDPVKRNTDFTAEFEYHKKNIAIIDEPIMRIKLSEMLDELLEGKEFQKAMLQKEIDFLIERKKIL